MADSKDRSQHHRRCGSGTSSISTTSSDLDLEASAAEASDGGQHDNNTDHGNICECGTYKTAEYYKIKIIHMKDLNLHNSGRSQQQQQQQQPIQIDNLHNARLYLDPQTTLKLLEENPEKLIQAPFLPNLKSLEEIGKNKKLARSQSLENVVASRECIAQELFSPFVNQAEDPSSSSKKTDSKPSKERRSIKKARVCADTYTTINAEVGTDETTIEVTKYKRLETPPTMKQAHSNEWWKGVCKEYFSAVKIVVTLISLMISFGLVYILCTHPSFKGEDQNSAGGRLTGGYV